MEAQNEIDVCNREFWNTLCGSSLASMLGIDDISIGSLKKFDTYYMSFYPYLLKHVPIHEFWGKAVLEIGLGYGTLSHQIASACDFKGLDIAAGPVALVNERIRVHGYGGNAVEGSILNPPFEPESFDVVVSIGCLHHTGNMPLAINNIRRLLKPGGRFIFMVYNAYSYRRWLSFPTLTIRGLATEYFGVRRVKATAALRRAYDGNDETCAPETEFYSSRQIRNMLQGFNRISITKENGDVEALFKRWSRADVLRRISPYLGLDLYVSAYRD